MWFIHAKFREDNSIKSLHLLYDVPLICSFGAAVEEARNSMILGYLLVKFKRQIRPHDCDINCPNSNCGLMIMRLRIYVKSGMSTFYL